MKKQVDNKEIEKITKEALSEAEKNIKRDRYILFSVIVGIEVVLVIISIICRWFSISEFLINIINNIIGILPPILLFDFFYEKISNQSSSIEMSKKITSTMMGQPDTLKLFNVEDRRKFLESTVNSVIDDEDLTAMILDNVNRYVIDPESLDVRIRKEFTYNIELDEDLPRDYEAIFDDVKEASKKYFLTQEVLSYTAKYFKKDLENKREVCIGFTFSNERLDDALRDKVQIYDEYEREVETQSRKSYFVFRESLDVYDSERERLLEYLRADDGKTTEKKFADFFKLQLKIDSKLCALKRVILREGGIIAVFDPGEQFTIEDYSVSVIFSMPKKWGSVIEVAIVDPTYSPKITFSYPRDLMKVDMYAFLNKSDDTSLSQVHEQMNGYYDIRLREWVYPISGMVFDVDKVVES